MHQIPGIRYPESNTANCRSPGGRETGTIPAYLLATRGTPAFFEHSKELYGEPTNELENGSSTIIDLANHFDRLFDRVKHEDLGAAVEMPSVSAETLAQKMREAVDQMFGEHAPEVVMDPSLASNALAGRRRIAIRPTAQFNDKDVDQLIQHEDIY